MLNNEKNRIVIDPKAMDSDEERDFYSWLLEAESAGLVVNIVYHPRTFKLSGRATKKQTVRLKIKTKVVDKFLLHPHAYTPDFTFEWVGKGSPFIDTKDVIWVDVKGSGSKYHDGKSFSINQKWTYDRYWIFINKVVPEKLFKKTWCPEACRYSPKIKKPVKKYIGVGNIGDYMVMIRNIS